MFYENLNFFYLILIFIFSDRFNNYVKNKIKKIKF